MRQRILRGLARTAAALGVLVVMAACQDLHVENPNDPDRGRALSEPGDVMVLVQSSWNQWWQRHHRSCYPGYAMWSQSGEQTTSVGNCGGWPWGAAEPRTRYNNTTTGAETSVAQSPWYGLYTDVSSANEGLISISQGMEFGPGGEDTRMVEAFARFTWGLNMGWISKFFDQAFIVRAGDDLEDSSTYETEPWQDVRAAAIESLMQAADIAEANSFTIPDNWINGEVIPSERLSQLAHTYAAYLHVYGARDPDQRAAVDWDQVLFHLDRGITEDFAPIAGSGEAPYSLYRYRINATGTFSWRTSNWLLGPGDITGAWQEWLNTPLEDRRRFVIESADRRIHPEGDPMQEGDIDWNQTYFMFREAGRPGGSIEGRGLYLHSYYLWNRGADEWAHSVGGYTNGPIEAFSVDEVDLIRAEAYYYTGQTEAAEDIINRFRERGELPPITVAEGVPATADCVPRKPNGSCGDFVDALAWERGIELVGLRGIRAFFDRRGFGQMVCGSMQHLPMPARELEAQLMAVYSFGGEGGEGAMNEPHCIPSVGGGS